MGKLWLYGYTHDQQVVCAHHSLRFLCLADIMTWDLV